MVEKKVKNMTLYTLERVAQKQGFGAYLELDTKNNASYKDSPAKRLREALEEIGGSFILLGKMISCRVDLIPADFCKELSRIKDVDAPVSYKDIEEQLEKSYSRPIQTLFVSVNRKPTEVNVLTQTHQAKLSSGESVLVKIKKPRFEKKLAQELRVMQHVVAKLKKTAPEIQGAKILRELGDYLKKKLDLRNEMQFLEASAQTNTSHFIPQVYGQLSNKNVLVYSYIKKRKHSSASAKSKYEEQLHIVQGEFIIFFMGILLIFISFITPGIVSIFTAVTGGILLLLVIFILFMSRKHHKK